MMNMWGFVKQLYFWVILEISNIRSFYKMLNVQKNFLIKKKMRFLKLQYCIIAQRKKSMNLYLHK